MNAKIDRCRYNNNNNNLVFYIALFLKDQSAVISLPLVNHQNQVASFRRAAMKARLLIST